MTVEVTDGWYSMQAVLDAQLSCRVREGKLRVGYKILTCGAELTAPVPFSPLGCAMRSASVQTDKAYPRLKLYMNSTRRARWDSRLGFSAPHFFPVALPTLQPGGGTVACVDIVVLRTCALQYLEKQVDGRTVVRDEEWERRMARLQASKAQEAQQRSLAALRESWGNSSEAVSEE